jgi:transcriptional regulator NrdR family protein
VKCLYCNSDTSVINSRLQKRANQVWRRRQCKACKAVFTTLEAVELPLALFVDSRGRSEPFLPDKLYTEILLALQDHKDAYIAAREVSNTVIMQLLKLPEKPFFPRTRRPSFDRFFTNPSSLRTAFSVITHPRYQPNISRV